MQSSILRRGLLAVLTASIALAAVSPVAADTRLKKIEPTGVVRYKVGRTFTPSTDVTSVSGYAAWMIDDFLAANTPLPRLGAAFTKAERKEGINARYFLAHAMLESGWGTSDIARYKRNLFGYNAFDRNPWKHASSFTSYQRGIAVIAARIHERYLTPTGRWFYRFTTPRAINRYYASDPRWADKVARLANIVDHAIVTLRERHLRFGTPTPATRPVVRGRVAVDVPWTARPGAVLPSRIRFAVRWTPVALVEAAAVGPTKAARPSWKLVRRHDQAGHVARLSLATPGQPGLWRLDVEARDSDGRALPKTDRPKIRSIVVRVAGPREATVSIAVSSGGDLVATVRNVGSRPIVTVANATPTTIEAWALPLDPAARAFRLAVARLESPIATGSSRTIRFAAPDVPSVVVVRLAAGPAAVARVVPVAALAVPGRDGRTALTALVVSSPRDDALLKRKPAAGPVSIASVADAGTVRVVATGGLDAPDVSSEVASVEAAPGPFSLLVRSLAAEPVRTAAPSRALVALPASSGSTTVAVAGLSAGVRLVMAAIVPPDGGLADVRTIRLAWITVGAIASETASPD